MEFKMIEKISEDLISKKPNTFIIKDLINKVNEIIDITNNVNIKKPYYEDEVLYSPLSKRREL